MFKRKRAYVISEHPVRHFFDELWQAGKGILALGKRLALTGLIAWGGAKYIKKGGETTLKEGLSARLSEVSNIKILKDFREGVGMIKEAMQPPSPAERAAEEKRLERVHKEKEELKKSLGVDHLGLEYIDRKDPRWSQAVKDNRELMKHFNER